jgi:hypothetical protein
MDTPLPNLEIVGLFESNNGRSCCQHEICGRYVRNGDLLRLSNTIVTINEKTEPAVKLVKVQDGADTCTVGFIPRSFAGSDRVMRSINRFCQVVELYSDSDSKTKRKLSHHNRGMASVVLLDDIPVDE